MVVRLPGMPTHVDRSLLPRRSECRRWHTTAHASRRPLSATYLRGIRPSPCGLMMTRGMDGSGSGTAPCR
jgi:hypothetical protein